MKILEGKHQGTPNLKILRSRQKGNSRTLWRLTRTQEHEERTPNLKFLENQTKIFENQREINKKRPNLKFGTQFNREIIIYEKEGFEKNIKDSNPITKNTDWRSSQMSYGTFKNFEKDYFWKHQT